MAYLEPESEAKGFFLFQEALDKLWKNDRRFRLKLYFKPLKLSPYMEVHDRYTYRELENIFDHTDFLAAPSIWRETYGYTVLEALSYDVPVLISSNVKIEEYLTYIYGDAYMQLPPEEYRNSSKPLEIKL